MLLDMHIPDWDEEFLAKYDPEALADAYGLAGVSGVLFYCKSHMGMNYWPSPVGGIHRAAKDRDLVGELYNALKRRNIAPAAYHSVVFDNWATENHPEWANVPISMRNGIDHPYFGAKYGTASLANLEYREYEKTQIRALLERYDFDALFLDMTFWNAISIDDVSVARFREETGRDIPLTLDWSDPEFVDFQRARERWLLEFIQDLIATAKSVRPEIAVTHNISPGTHGWYTGQKLSWSNLDTYASGDIYGGRDEQLLISKLMQHLGARQPAEFMTTRTDHLWNHVELKTEHAMTIEALGTVAHAGAFLFIDAIDPRGTVNPDVYRRLGRVFEHVKKYEAELGGTQIEDVAIYYSDDARVLPQQSGTELANVGLDAIGHTETGKGQLPHVNAVTRAAAKLQRAHIPFGVITEVDLQGLDRYRVLVLPDLVRINDAELAAFRRYVENGGRLYASGRTSLLNANGNAYEDFALADVLGVHLGGREDGPGFFLKPASALAKASVYPEHYLGYGFVPNAVGGGYPQKNMGLPRLSVTSKGTVHATLNLPYGYPSTGSRSERDYASIHSSPPWEDRAEPALVEHFFGRGRTFYSVAPIEQNVGDAEGRLFISIIKDLLEGPVTLSATAHPSVWVTGFVQPHRSRVVVSALAYDTQAPLPVTPLTVRYQPAPDQHVTGVARVGGGPVTHVITPDGAAEFHVHDLDMFAMLAITYETIGG
jgi:hypothetical protein